MGRLRSLTQREHCILLHCSIRAVGGLVLYATSLCFIDGSKGYTCNISSLFFLDEISFSRPDRIIPIAERFGMDPGAVLDNVRLIFCDSPMLNI